MKKVTAWHKVIRDKVSGEVTSMPFNHLEDGWSMDNKPAPKSPLYTNQLAWQNDDWMPVYKFLRDDCSLLLLSTVSMYEHDKYRRK